MTARMVHDHLVERSAHIPAVLRVTTPTHSDARGSICEGWNAKVLAADFVQMNISTSVPWVVRGMHYQAGKPQGKFVRCIQGAIFDVALDLRRSSPTFGQHASFELVGGQAMWVPEGFAHGFMSGPDGAIVVYMFTDYRDEASERAIVWHDSTISIPWPLPDGISPLVSPRDRAAPLFADVMETYP